MTFFYGRAEVGDAHDGSHLRELDPGAKVGFSVRNEIVGQRLKLDPELKGSGMGEESGQSIIEGQVEGLRIKGDFCPDVAIVEFRSGETKSVGARFGRGRKGGRGHTNPPPAVVNGLLNDFDREKPERLLELNGHDFRRRRTNKVSGRGRVKGTINAELMKVDRNEKGLRRKGVVVTEGVAAGVDQRRDSGPGLNLARIEGLPRDSKSLEKLADGNLGFSAGVFRKDKGPGNALVVGHRENDVAMFAAHLRDRFDELNKSHDTSLAEE
jgi:hypothetical protein